MSDGIEDLARRMLNAAYRSRQSMFGMSDVILPRGDQEVVRELGYDHHTAHELWAVEQWLEDRRYISAVPMHGRGGAFASWGFLHGYAGGNGLHGGLIA